jgi:glutamine---fructose-6-phosphate transaminase (isomerizing)
MSTKRPGFYTRQEILSQPGIWKKSLLYLSKLERGKYPDFMNYDQVIFIGCGSTFYLSRWAARTCEARTGLVSRAIPSSDLLLFPQAWLQKSKKTLFVAISRSAETTETIKALEMVRAGNYGEMVVVTCYRDRALAQLTPYVVDVPDAQEESVAQTRSFSNMMLAVMWLSDKKVPEGLPEAISTTGEKIITGNANLAQQIGLDETISKFFFLGSGPNYGLANEAMLKMKEMSLSYSEAYHFLEFRHGPMSMVDQNSIVIGLISDLMGNYEYSLLQEMKSRGARILGLYPGDVSPSLDWMDYTISLGNTVADGWRAPLYLPVLQLIAFERAIHKGLDPDSPKNLTSVVVLRG